MIYELEGCQKAVNFLSKYYGVKRMKINLNGRKVGRGYVAYYFEGEAYFTKRGLKICLNEERKSVPTFMPESSLIYELW
jgi:hypothetical protein